MKSSTLRSIKFGGAILFLALSALLFAPNRELSANPTPTEQTYQSPYSFHNFDYSYDFEYGFTAPYETGFQPSAEKNMIIAAVVPNDTEEEFRQFINGMRQEAKRQRVGLLVFSADNLPEKQSALIQRISSEGVDALVLFPLAHSFLYPEIKKVKRENLSVVSLWERMDLECINMVDTFVGLGEKEFGEQLALWIAGLDSGSKKSIILLSTNDQQTIAESCLEKLQIYSKNISVYSTQPDTLEQTLSEAAQTGRGIQIVCTGAELAENALDASRLASNAEIFAAGERQEVLELLESGVIENGFYYSRQLEGETAVSAVVQTVRGSKGAVRVQNVAASFGEDVR